MTLNRFLIGILIGAVLALFVVSLFVEKLPMPAHPIADALHQLSECRAF